MSIADIQNQFKAAVDGKVILVRATMDYANGGAIQTFKFRVAKTNKGQTHEIEVECRDYKDIPSIVKIAAESALTWVAAND